VCYVELVSHILRDKSDETMSHVKSPFKKTSAAIMTILLLFIILSLSNVVAKAENTATITIPCNKDTYTDQRSPDTNYGDSATIVVRSGPDINARAYFGFPLENLPAGSVVVNATLTVYINQTGTSLRRYIANRLDRDWSEAETTWNNSTWWAQDCDVATVLPGQTEVSFDVTKVVSQYSSMGWPLTGFVVRDEREWDWRTAETVFASKENPSQSGAVLNITVSYVPDILIMVMPDSMNGFAGDSITYHYLLASLNQWTGTVQLAAKGVDSTMRVVFDTNEITLQPGEGRFGEFTIYTGVNTPPSRYNLRINATGTTGSGETCSHEETFWLTIDPMILLRNLPDAVYNDTDFQVTLTYYKGTISATSIVIQEQLPGFTSLVMTEGGQVNLTISGSYSCYPTWNFTDSGIQLKLLVVNPTELETFNITYWVHFSYTDQGQMPNNLHFNGEYGYLLTDGKMNRGSTLGKSDVEIPIGLPGQFDDDGRVDDWEIIQVIFLWMQGRLSDDDLLQYIMLWRTTTWNNPPPGP
jgi:hypothetical protein